MRSPNEAEARRRYRVRDSIRSGWSTFDPASVEPLMMRILRNCVLLAALAACATHPRVVRDGAQPSAPTVTIDAGPLAGSIDSSSGVLVFRGVPYAAPPVGDLRWRAPMPAAHWTGVRAADRLGKNCIQ